MNKPRYRRRKDRRPEEIASAALEVFAEKGFTNSRVADVTARAGVSKGLMYLYFKTKEDLFRAVIRNVVEPRVQRVVEAVDQWQGSATDFLRGPFKTAITEISSSKAVIVVRLLLTEGSRHPNLTRYYHQHVVSIGLAAMQRLIDKAVADGEFRKTGVEEFPQLMLAPVILAVAWKNIFEPFEALPTGAFFDAHVETLVAALTASPDLSRPT